MERGDTYVYFALKGDFDPQVATDRIGITPTEISRKGDRLNSKRVLEFSSWILSTAKGKEYIYVEKLVEEVVDELFDKIDVINELKKEFDLSSVLEVVLYIDTNEEETTPALGHKLKTIEFLYRTKTVTDIDIYRFNSLNS